MFEVSHLSFAYRQHSVLNDVSFAAKAGETIVLAGDSGAGKTTLLRVLAGVRYADSGTVKVDGVEIRDDSVRYLRRIGYMPEASALIDGLTVKSYLQYRARLKGETSRRLRRRVSEAVELCLLGRIVDVPIGKLSNGQRRLVSLADALLMRPRVLLIDDPFAGLDRQARPAVGAALKSAAAFSVAILAGNDLHETCSIASRALVLSGGRIAADLSVVGSDAGGFRARIEAALGGGGAQ